MRVPPLRLLLVAIALLATSCGASGGLRKTVRALEPQRAEVIGECQEYGGLAVDDPGYGCAYFVPGTRRAVSRSLAAELEHQGFDIVCEEDRISGTIDLRGRRGRTSVSAEVSRLGSVITMDGEAPLEIYGDTRFLRTDYRVARPHHVIVKVVALERESELGGGTRACREYVGILRA